MSLSQNPDALSAPSRQADLPSPPMLSPLYRQIKGVMLRALSEGEWGPGAAIPSEAELAARFGVSQGTVRRAIDEMATENLLVRRQGKGTFVATHNDPRAFYRFLRLASNDGSVRPTRSVPLSCRETTASAAVARALRLPDNAAVVALERVLNFAGVNGEHVVWDEIFLPCDIFRGLTLERLQQEERSLYSIFESWFGVRMIRAEEQLRAIAADARAALRLEVPEGSPLLLVERVTYTYDDRPVEWRRGFYNTEHYHYFNELS
jgi:GntR family transcriptional regulator